MTDLKDIEKLLKFQNHSFDHYLEDLRRAFGWRRFFTRMFGPVIRFWIVKQSPYYKTS